MSLFYEINSAEPVRFIDLNLSTTISHEDEDEQLITTNTTSTTNSKKETKPKPIKQKLTTQQVNNIITDAVEELSMKYEIMFKPTSRCRPPHLNVDVLRDDLFRADFIHRYDITSKEELLLKLDEINKLLGDKYDKELGEKETQALVKAKANSFYLGLADKRWMHD